MFSTTTLAPKGCVPPYYFAPMLEHSSCFTQSEVSGLEPATRSTVKVRPPKWRLCRPKSHIDRIIAQIRSAKASEKPRLTTWIRNPVACGGFKYVNWRAHRGRVFLAEARRHRGRRGSGWARHKPDQGVLQPRSGSLIHLGARP